ncbi:MULTISPECIES: hypothetical protein [Pseudomonas]|uniref:hypothetical protein n=1 Tax=Pseudomonas TaxID=286 RepID=UPI001BEB6CCC|nr:MULTISPECIES: hypothetical protein [Pseudomonas]MBT2339442.1 hypothetical protein [Pseudomonas fluorescens]MCD4529322.1 hypothetical protein [Pseudomonas sp. C3-2018]
MSVETHPNPALQRDQAIALFDQVLVLNHNLIDVNHAIDKAWSTGDYTLVQATLVTAQQALSAACELTAKLESRS